MTEQTATIERYLEDIRAALAADGYRLSVTDVTPDTLFLEIGVTDDACPECLVPANMMETIIRAAIPDAARFSTVAITYPAHSAVHG
jgi:uncharacterized membrane protein YkvA (DUF1232 family)